VSSVIMIQLIQSVKLITITAFKSLRN